MRDRVTIGGVAFDRLTAEGVVAQVLAARGAGQGGMIVTPNLQFIHRAQRDPEVATLLAGADLAVADGMPVIWASRLARDPLPQRIGGIDLLVTLCAALAPLGGRVYLLGGRPGMAEAAGAHLIRLHPGLIIAGTACPPLGFEHDPAAVAALAAGLSAATPDLVLVAFGMPKQERFIAAHRSLLPAAWWMGIGGSFEMLTGQVVRAPVWMRRTGLEWVHRLACEPRRLARRYLVEGIPTAVDLLLRSAGRGAARTAGSSALSRPYRLLRALPSMCRLAWITARLADDAWGRELHRRFRHRSPLYGFLRHHAYGRALLALPATKADYLKGKDKQALRTNCTRAVESGYSFRVLDPAADFTDLMAIHRSSPDRQGAPVGRHLLDESRMFRDFATYRDCLCGIVDPTGSICAYVAYRRSGEVVILDRLLGHVAHRQAGVMYLLVAELIARLIAEQSAGEAVRIVVFDAYYGHSEGLQYFMRRSGFRPCHVHWLKEPEAQEL